MGLGFTIEVTGNKFRMVCKLYYKTLNPELARWSPKKPYYTDEGSKKRGPFLASEPYYIECNQKMLGFLAF